MIRSDKVYTTSIRPASRNTKTMHITIYSSPNIGVQYIRDKQDCLVVQKIGEIEIDAPNPNNLPESQRTTDITMDFSGTEIKAKARYRLTGVEVHTVCDFLSCQQS